MKPIDRAAVAASPETDGLPTPRRYFAALTIWLAIFMSVLDSSIANVALPTIARELGATASGSVWIINGFQLASTAFLLPFAALGDRIGYHRVYLPGMALFIIASLACALAPSLEALVAARVLQGTGAAAIMSINAALVRATYPNAMLGRGLGYNALVVSIAAAAGPTIAAALLNVAHWPILFAINLPFGLIAVIIGAKALPHAGGRGSKLDLLSAFLSALSLGLIIFGAEILAREGLLRGAPLLVAGLGCGAFLVRREWHRPAPLVPLDLLRIRIFRLSIATSVTSFAAQMLAFVSLPFLFQSVMGRSVVETGLLMTPWPLALACVAPISGRLADRFHAGLLGGIGLFIFAAGLLALAVMGDHPTTVDIVWRMALCGIGFGLFQAPNNRTIVGSAPRERSGAAGGMLATARLIGQTAGAVTVAVGFHWNGVGATPSLLTAAGVAAAIAALTSLSRMRAAPPPRQNPPDAPLLD